MRDDAKAIDLAAWVTGLGPDEVRARFKAKNGRALVRTALEERWPWSAGALAQKSAAIARDAGLHAEIRWATGGSKHVITRRLNAAAGNRQLKNLFWDLWPEDETRPPPSTETIEGEDPVDDAPTMPAGPPAAASVEAAPAAPTHDTEPPPPGFQPGAFISSRYDVKEEIGRGGFGTTWLAHDRLSGLDVVLKVPHENDGGAIRHELELAFQLVHPNICQAFPDREDVTGQPFLVMQHGGLDLRRCLEDRGGEPLPLAQALHVLTSVADALDYLHSRLVLHLDVSPMNVLLDDEDVVRLTDFGSSARARRAGSPEGPHTVLAPAVTSLNGLWSAPEIFKGVGRSRSDQYSLFLVFATLLTGKVPTRHAEMPAPPFDVLSDAQNAAVARALSLDPEARFETCGEAARAVADGLANVPTRVLTGDLETLATDLRARLRREHARPAATHTTQVGAVVKVGSGIERLLLGVYLWLAAQEGFSPGADLQKFPGVTLQRASGGLLAKLLRSRAVCASAKRPEVSAIMDDLAGTKSRIHRLIRLRNEVAHQGVIGGGLDEASDDVAKLLDGYVDTLMTL